MKDAKFLESIPVSERRKVDLSEYGRQVFKEDISNLSETALKCSRTRDFFEVQDSETNENFIICEARYRFGTLAKCHDCGIGFSISSAKALGKKKLEVDEVPLVKGNVLTFYKELTPLRREPLELAIVIPMRKLRKAGVSLSPGQLVEVKIRPMRIVE